MENQVFFNLQIFIKILAQDSARNAQSDDNRVKGQVRYVQKKDSIIDPDIHENFYPEGSL